MHVVAHVNCLSHAEAVLGVSVDKQSRAPQLGFQASNFLVLGSPLYLH